MEQSYTVVLAVTGRVCVPVAPAPVPDMCSNASKSVSEMDFGPLTDIDWTEVHIETPDGSYIDPHEQPYPEIPLPETDLSGEPEGEEGVQYVFWSCEKPPFVLSGTVEEIYSSGSVFVKEYQRCFPVDTILGIFSPSEAKPYLDLLDRETRKYQTMHRESQNRLKGIREQIRADGESKYSLAELFTQLQNQKLPHLREADHQKIARVLSREQGLTLERARFLVHTVYQDLCREWAEHPDAQDSDYYLRFRRKLEQYLEFLKKWKDPSDPLEGGPIL